MAPLVFLLVSFGLFFAINKYALKNRFSLSFCGRAAMSVMLIVTGISHFTSTEQMIQIMPDAVPAKRAVVYFTGICELAAVIGLLIPQTARLTAILLIVFFAAVLPANIAGSFKQVEMGGMEYGPWYLLFRVPLQLFFIWWVYYFGIRKRERVE